MNKNLEKLSNMAKGENMINMSTDLNPLKKEKKEAVNHPAHYNRPNSMECIDEMLLVFGEEAVMNFCLCNSWKYRYRAGDKNGAEDIAKSDWYLAKYKELKDKKQWKAATNTTVTPTITIPCNTKVETINAEYINNNECDPKLYNSWL